MTALIALFWRGLRRAWGSGALWLPVLFFLLVATAFPFAVGPDAPLLRRAGGGMVWVAALLAALLPVDRLVRPDRDAGVLDQLGGIHVRNQDWGLERLVHALHQIRCLLAGGANDDAVRVHQIRHCATFAEELRIRDHVEFRVAIVAADGVAHLLTGLHWNGGFVHNHAVLARL